MRSVTAITLMLGALACTSTDPTIGGGGSVATGGTGGDVTTAPTSTSSAQTAGGGGAAVADGTFEHPFPIDSLPFVGSGDTSTAPASVADAYTPCAPATNEAGPEIVYRVTVDEVGWLWARVDDVAGDTIDVDVHLLREPSPDACVTRADVELGAPVHAGDYWIVVDTWVDGAATALAGAYTLEVGLITEAGDQCYVSPIQCDPTIPPYVNGTPYEEPGAPGCLPGMARIDGFCIDRYEAMLAEVLPNQTLVAWSPYANPGNVEVMALSVAGVVPQGFITQVQAADACAVAGKRLCDDTEWQRACAGSAATTYPYGNTRQPGVCNDARDCHPVIQTFESDEAWVWSQLDDPCIPQLPEGLAPTGTYANCESGEGVFDMMGNLHEWTSDPAGTFRGGFYVDTAINGNGCNYATTAHNIYHWDYSTGFRCCADPQ